MGIAQRLYRVRCDQYVQYDGVSALPPEIAAYRARNKGDDPPHIPLPQKKVTFRVGVDYACGRKVLWNGKGPLPSAVLAYVCENGTLPHYDGGDTPTIDKLDVDD